MNIWQLLFQAWRVCDDCWVILDLSELPFRMIFCPSDFLLHWGTVPLYEMPPFPCVLPLYILEYPPGHTLTGRCCHYCSISCNQGWRGQKWGEGPILHNIPGNLETWRGPDSAGRLNLKHVSHLKHYRDLTRFGPIANAAPQLRQMDCSSFYCFTALHLLQMHLI